MGTEHNPSRRRFLIRISQVAGTLALSACGGTPQPADQGFQAQPAATPAPTGAAPTTGAVATEAASAAATEAPAGAAATTEATAAPAGGAVNPDLTGQIIISIIQDIPDEAQKALIDAYRERRPNVEVLFERPGAAEENYDTYLGTLLAAGNPRPDIVSPNYSFRGFVNFDRYRKTTNPHTGNLWEEDYDFQLSQYNPFVENVMLPTRAVHINWFYNKALFDQAQVTPPTTWSEFVAVCDKLQAAGITPVSANYMWQVPQWVVEIYFDQYFINWVETVRSQPGDWNYVPELDDNFTFDPNDPDIHKKYTFNAQRYWKGLRDGELSFDTPEMTEIVKNLAQVFPKNATKDFFVIEDNYVPFLQQQAAMMINGSWMYETLTRDMGELSPERLEELELPENAAIKSFEWDTFEVTPMEGPLVKSPIRSVESASGEYLGIIDKNQQQTELVLDFFMFWLSSAGYQPFFDGRVAADDLGASGPLMVRNVTETPELDALLKRIKFLGNAENQFNWIYLYLGGGDQATTAKNLLKDSLEGKNPPEDFGTRLQAYVTENFDAIIEAVGFKTEDIDNPARQPGA